MAFSQTFIAGVDVLGAVLLHFLWQGAALGLLYALLRPLCASVIARYRVGMIMLLGLALCPLMTLLYAWPAGGVSAAVTTGVTSALAGSVSAIDLSGATDWGPRQLLPWLVAVWMGGVVVIAMRWLWDWRRLARLVRYPTTPLPEWDAALKKMCERFGLKRPVRLLASDRVSTPMLFGWITPVILLPLSMLSGFTPHQIELIIAHELGHVRRWDYLANLMQVVIETVLFYHPVVHWICRDVRNARENCCDDLVLRLAKGNPIAYARTLADLEELRHEVTSPALGASGGVLLARIRRIVSVEGPDPLPRNNGWAVLLIAAALVCIAVRPQHAVPDLIRPDLLVALANAPAQGLAILSGNPRLARTALSGKPKITGATVTVVDLKPLLIATTPRIADAAAPLDTSARVPVQIARPTVDRVALAAITPVRDIAPSRSLTVIGTLPDTVDLAHTLAPEFPARRHVVPPVYPLRAMSSRLEGNVELQYGIGADGSVHDVQVLHAHPEGIFDAAAQVALSQWRFEPSASRDANFRYSQIFTFTLSGASTPKQACRQVIGSLICRHPDE